MVCCLNDQPSEIEPAREPLLGDRLLQELVVVLPHEIETRVRRVGAGTRGLGSSLARVDHGCLWQCAGAPGAGAFHEAVRKGAWQQITLQNPGAMELTCARHRCSIPTPGSVRFKGRDCIRKLGEVSLLGEPFLQTESDRRL